MDISQYKDVYVFVEQRDGAVQSVGLELLGKARQLADTLNEKVVAILLGKNIADKAQGLIAAGADRVLVVDDDRLATYLTEPYAEAVSQIKGNSRPRYFSWEPPSSDATSLRGCRLVSAQGLLPTALSSR